MCAHEVGVVVVVFAARRRSEAGRAGVTGFYYRLLLTVWRCADRY